MLITKLAVSIQQTAFSFICVFIMMITSFLTNEGSIKLLNLGVSFSLYALCFTTFRFIALCFNAFRFL